MNLRIKSQQFLIKKRKNEVLCFGTMYVPEQRTFLL